MSTEPPREQNQSTARKEENWEQHVASFLDGTTAHGLGRMTDPNLFRRYLWRMVVLGTLAGFLYLVIQIVIKVQNPSTSTSITKSVDEKASLPTVTFCNVNMYNKTRIFQDPRLRFEADLFLKAARSYYSSSYDEQTTEKIAKSIASWGGLQGSDYDLVTNSTYENSTLDLLGLFRKVSHSKEKTIVNALNKGALVPRFYDAITTEMTDMGYCFSYTPDNKVTQTGALGGISLHLDVHPEEYTFNELDPYNEGFKIGFHTPGDVPRLKESGTALVAGYSYFIGIKRTQRLFTEYDGCVRADSSETGQERKLTFYDQYSRNNCFRECEFNFTYNMCGCRLFFQPGNKHYCQNGDDIKVCMGALDLFHVSRDGRNACDCPVACIEHEFEATVSQYVYPSTYHAKFLQEFGDTKEQRTSQLIVNVYLESLEVTTIEQMIAYTVKDVWGDIGGCLGLCLGASVVTIIEALDFAVASTMLLVAKYSPHHKKSTKCDQVSPMPESCSL